MTYESTFTVAYTQIYVLDAANLAAYAGRKWTEKELTERICVGETFFIMGTESDISVPFSLHIMKAKPNINFGMYDHVVECSIKTSGAVYVSGDIDDESWDIKATIYSGVCGVLCCFENLGSVSADGLSSDDKYHVFMWPEEMPIPKRVLKQWTGGADAT